MNQPLSHGNLVTTIKDGLAITTTRAGAHVSTVRASTASVAPLAKSALGRVPNTPAAGTRTTSSGQLARPAAAKQPAAKSSNTSRAPARATTNAAPFSALMGDFRASAAKPARAASSSSFNDLLKEPRSKSRFETQRWPEMTATGVATGRFIEVRVPTATAPEIDAAALAKQILAAGRKARGEK